MKFKVNNKVHDPEMNEAEGLAFLQARHPNAIIIPITDAEAAELLAPIPQTPEEIEAEKTAKIEAELGGDNIRILIETFLDITRDGTIQTDTVDQVIEKAKAKRRLDL